jgi:hypothetical protein
MNIIAAKMSLLLVLILCSFGFSAYALGSEESQKIIVIYRASTKDPAVKLTLDGKENGSLTGGTYIELPTDDGKHVITAGMPVQKTIDCLMGWGGNNDAPLDHIKVNFRPASITVDAAKTVYILAERFRPETVHCMDMSRNLNKFTDYKLREIKPPEAEKLMQKYQQTQ